MKVEEVDQQEVGQMDHQQEEHRESHRREEGEAGQKEGQEEDCQKEDCQEEGHCHSVGLCQKEVARGLEGHRESHQGLDWRRSWELDGKINEEQQEAAEQKEEQFAEPRSDFGDSHTGTRVHSVSHPEP
jgi:hypothetical protein